MKCFNCSASALYVVADPGVSVVYYCSKCLPAFLRPRADAGQLDIPTQTTTKKKKKTETPAEPPEETPSETTDESNED